LSAANPPQVVGLLVGGNTGAFSYRSSDWQKMLQFMRETHAALGIRWLVTTSRRSGPKIAAALAELAADPSGGVAQFIDYHTAGPGTLADILARAEAILVTSDSTTMISEAIGACLPVIGIEPDGVRQEERETEYRAFLSSRGWYRALRFSELTPPRFLSALSEIVPRQTSALDELAAALAERLPQLF
jgi:mitochondrial fission protein ELM1